MSQIVHLGKMIDAHGDRLRKLEAGLLGLKDRVEAHLRRHDDLDRRADAMERKLNDTTPFDPPLSGCRETAWAVKTSGMNHCVAVTGGGSIRQLPLGDKYVRRFNDIADAETLCRLLGVGEPMLVYTDTMEEVNP